MQTESPLIKWLTQVISTELFVSVSGGSHNDVIGVHADAMLLMATRNTRGVVPEIAIVIYICWRLCVSDKVGTTVSRRVFPTSSW